MEPNLCKIIKYLFRTVRYQCNCIIVVRNYTPVYKPSLRKPLVIIISLLLISSMCLLLGYNFVEVMVAQDKSAGVISPMSKITPTFPIYHYKAHIFDITSYYKQV